MLIISTLVFENKSLDSSTYFDEYREQLVELDRKWFSSDASSIAESEDDAESAITSLHSVVSSSVPSRSVQGHEEGEKAHEVHISHRRPLNLEPHMVHMSVSDAKKLPVVSQGISVFYPFIHRFCSQRCTFQRINGFYSLSRYQV